MNATKNLDVDTPSSRTPRVAESIVRGRQGPRVKGGEPRGAGWTVAEAVGCGWQVIDGGERNGQIVRLYGKAEELPPTHVTSVLDADAGRPKTNHPAEQDDWN
jgi:hypothetical protein